MFIVKSLLQTLVVNPCPFTSFSSENVEYLEAIGNPSQFHYPFADRRWTVRKAAKNRTKTKVDNNKPRRENGTKGTKEGNRGNCRETQRTERETGAAN